MRPRSGAPTMRSGMDHFPDGADSSADTIRIVLANMPQLLREIIRDLLAGERALRVDELSSLEGLQDEGGPGSAVIVIEGGHPDFVHACEMLPNVRVVGITRDWRNVSVRFTDLTRERLRAAIRFVAGEHVT